MAGGDHVGSIGAAGVWSTGVSVGDGEGVAGTDMIQPAVLSARVINSKVIRMRFIGVFPFAVVPMNDLILAHVLIGDKNVAFSRLKSEYRDLILKEDLNYNKW